MLKLFNYMKFKLKLIKIIYKVEKFNVRDYLIFHNKILNLKYIVKEIFENFNKINSLIEIFCGYNKLTEYIIKLYKINKVKLSDISINIFLLKNLILKNIKIKLIKKYNLKNIKLNKFDLLIMNPPYISYKNKNLKTINLKFQPINSLTDFNKGINFYKNFKNYIIKFIKNFKYILLEINKNKLNYIIKKFKNLKLLKLINV